MHLYIPFPRPLPTCGGAAGGQSLLPLPHPRPLIDGGAVGERVGVVDVVDGGAVEERVTGVVDTVTCNYNYSCSPVVHVVLYVW